MKITATEIQAGMEIQIANLWDNSKGSEPSEFDYQIETMKLKKSSPIYKVESVTGPIVTKRYRTQQRSNTSKVMVLTLKGVDGTVEVSTKQKIKLV